MERELDVEPHDFRLWVCLHEETHRTQFTAVPWLRDHLEGEIQSFLAETDVDPMTFLERIRDAAQSLAAVPRARRRTAGAPSWNWCRPRPSGRSSAKLTAVMSLLEGHADYVMDGVGPSVVPSVAEIREKFQQRRAKGASRLDAALRKLLGLDAKLRQYRDGERFVRAVVEQVGTDGFNRVWTSPNTLPTKAEIAKPADWVARVHGRAEG
ncbi:zinc-dependent metalloprotease [Streptomyces nogalater]